MKYAILTQIDRRLSDPAHGKHCDEWTWGEFYECAGREIARAVADRNFGCSLVWWADYFADGVEECEVGKDEGEVIRFARWLDSADSVMAVLTSRPHLLGCPFPCQRLQYKADCMDFDPKNTHLQLVETNSTDTEPREVLKKT